MTRELVVDDSAQIRRMVRVTVERRGIRVIEAEDGLVAWRLMAEERPDVVILDVMMPGPTGLELCRAIRADPALSGVPVVILTADGLEATEADARAAGASAFVTKPFLPSTLRALVESLVDG